LNVKLAGIQFSTVSVWKSSVYAFRYLLVSWLGHKWGRHDYNNGSYNKAQTYAKDI